MSRFCTVTIGYNRVDSLLRLLQSVENADYGEDECTLIVSLDNCGNYDVYNMANAFQWSHGEKRVVLQEKRLGLKNHILKCGDYLKEFEAGAILEDDIVVSSAYYQYMKQAVAYYRDDQNIAGISLYTHLRNPMAKYAFEPAKTIYDTYFIQYAQSWGQIWINDHWEAFKRWLQNNDTSFRSAPCVPQNVSEWSDRSWLKYHIRYCIEENKYFVYSYDAYSTCFSEAGEHCWLKQNVHQVPMLYDARKKYRFAPFNDKYGAVFYDAYFERQHLRISEVDSKEGVTIDLYGNKKITDYDARFVLSSSILDYKVVKSYGREMRPQEMNILCGIEGEDYFLYDTNENVHNHRKKNEVNEYIYFNKVLGHTGVIVRVLVEKFREKVYLIWRGVKNSLIK